jgi:hypothetical protein
MFEILLNLYDFFIVFVIILIVFAILSFLLTRHYKESRIKFYALFFNSNERHLILFSSCLVNLILTIYLVLNIERFDIVSIYIIIFNSIAFILLAFNIRLLFIDLLYSASIILILRLLLLVDLYLENVYFDNLIYFLKVIFVILIIFYSLLANLRKYELILTSNKYVRRNS